MTKQEQKQLLEDMCDDLKAVLLEKIDRIPENWDGYELRQYFLDKASNYCWIKMDRTRKRNYNNDFYSYNL